MVTFDQIKIIIEQATVPVVVDAGIGAPSDAAIAMEMGADACLVNTAVAQAGNPALMAEAMAQAVQAGRAAFLAGRMPKKRICLGQQSPGRGCTLRPFPAEGAIMAPTLF